MHIYMTKGFSQEYQYRVENNNLYFEDIEVTIPKYSEPGTWRLGSIYFR